MKVLTATALPTFVFLFSLTPARAQLQAGLRLGANLAQVHGDHVNSPDKGIGYQAGIFTRFSIKGVHVQPEILATARNYKFTQVINENGVFSSVEKEIKASYLEVPFLLIFDVGDKVDLVLGPYFSFRTSLRQSLPNGINSDGYELDGSDGGIMGGVGYFLNNGIDFSLRGQYGFSGFYKSNQNVPGPKYLDVGNLSFQFTVGLPISGSGNDEIPKTYKESY